VFRITKDELKCVRSGRQLDSSLRLPTSEMEVLFVVWYWLIDGERFVDVDEEVMVARVLVVISRVCHPHISQTEAAPERAFNALTIRRPYEIEVCVLRR
jgi:hypothetical protein